jgi:hypothetical protein
VKNSFLCARMKLTRITLSSVPLRTFYKTIIVLVCNVYILYIDDSTYYLLLVLMFVYNLFVCFVVVHTFFVFTNCILKSSYCLKWNIIGYLFSDIFPRMHI